MTTYAKKAAFCQTPPYSWDAPAPETVAVKLNKSGVPVDLTQSPKLLRFPFGLVPGIRPVGLILKIRLIGRVVGKALVSLFVCGFLIAFGH
jgi:hypothetical protein